MYTKSAGQPTVDHPKMAPELKEKMNFIVLLLVLKGSIRIEAKTKNM